MEILRADNICKTYDDGHLVLDNVSLVVNEGDIYGILGLSGAGKSTLVRCLKGLEPFDSGKILYCGQEVVFDRQYHRDVAMIFQSFNLLKQRNVLKNVMLAGEIVNDYGSETKAKKLLKLVGLESRMEAYPDELSGGEAQRVAIARALMTDPKILLCDEATSALDPDTTKQILKLLKELNEKLKLTIIIISHQMSVIEEICSRVAIIDHSEIVEEGAMFDVFLNPKTDIARRIIYAGHLNTKLSKKRHIKIMFKGEIDAPIIANIIQDCNLLISIVYADSKLIDGLIYGQIIFKAPEKKKDLEKLETYLRIKNINYEEVDFDGIN